MMKTMAAAAVRSAGFVPRANFDYNQSNPWSKVANLVKPREAATRSRQPQWNRRLLRQMGVP